MFSKLQAMMSIIEGYSNYIMNAVGERLLPSYHMIKERIEQRANNRSQIEKLFIKITGLALKMEQYRLGETFINEIVARTVSKPRTGYGKARSSSPPWRNCIILRIGSSDEFAG